MDEAQATHRGHDSRKDSWASRSGRPGPGDRARKRPSFQKQAQTRAAAAAAAPSRQQQLVSSYNLAWPALHAYLRELWPGEEFAECCRNDEFVLDLPEPLTKEQIAKISELRKSPPEEGEESE